MSSRHPLPAPLTSFPYKPFFPSDASTTCTCLVFVNHQFVPSFGYFPSRRQFLFTLTTLFQHLDGLWILTLYRSPYRIVHSFKLKPSRPLQAYRLNHHDAQISHHSFCGPCRQRSCLLAHGVSWPCRSRPYRSHHRSWYNFKACPLNPRIFW